MTKYLFTFLICICALPQIVSATAYYIDADCGTPGNGTTATCNGDADDSYDELDDFTEAARTAGDLVFVKRGTTATVDNASDLLFTSDGTVPNPLIITADYDNIWGNFATSTQTYTVAAATSTFTASAAQSDIVVGEWVYVEGDCFETPLSVVLNQCEFTYEVSAVASTSISLFLPYKGNQTGSGLDLRILPPSPQWNTAAGDFQWNFDTDNHWFVKGIDIRGTDANGQIESDSSGGLELFDVKLIGDGATSIGIGVLDDGLTITIKKTRFFKNDTGLGVVGTLDLGIFASIYDSIIDGDNEASSAGIAMRYSGQINLHNSILRNHGNGDLQNNGGIAAGTFLFFLRNTLLGSSVETFNSNSSFSSIYSEDHDNSKGTNKQILSPLTTTETATILNSTTAVLRSGGGPVSIQVTPTTNLKSTWGVSRLKLFEYPIYTDTTSRQYDVYFNSPSDTWTTNPTDEELWIECEYWAHTTGTANRKVKKSTGTVDFNGSTDWQSLSVTCEPTQTGILYLRGYYAKTKEAGTNLFYVDGTPVITP